LVDVVVFCELRPSTLKVLLAIAIIPHLHLVWDTLPDCSRRTASRSSRPSMKLVKFSGRR
jgi:hypothetical protein